MTAKTEGTPMSAANVGGNRVAHPVVQRTVDGGYSGSLTVTVGTGLEGVPPMLFIESDTLESTLVLSMSELATWDSPSRQLWRRRGTSSAPKPQHDTAPPPGITDAGGGSLLREGRLPKGTRP